MKNTEKYYIKHISVDNLPKKVIKGHSFLQSSKWAQFQNSVGNTTVGFKINENEPIVWAYKARLPGGNQYAYIPHLSNSDSLEALCNEFKEQGLVFVRVEPIVGLKLKKYKIKKVTSRQPQHTLVVDIKREETEILASMHSKTRYNIRLSERKGVEVKKEKNVEIFWKLLQETTGRDAFKGHAKHYYKKMLELDNVYGFNAYFENKSIASIIVLVHGKTMIYLHGASSNEFRNVMAPYLLQWHAIKLGKSLDCEHYDLWGVAPEEKKDSDKAKCFHTYCWNMNHKFSGISRFKAGFGGKPKSYPDTVEIILSPIKYKLYNLAKKIKGMI